MSTAQGLRQYVAPGSAGFQPAPEAGEMPGLPGNWQCMCETEIEAVAASRL